jgi:hypothetical protein
LSAKSSHAGPCNLRKPSVIGVSDDFEQLLDTSASDWCDDPELGQVRANGIDDGRLLADEQMSCAAERQTALLLGDLVGTNRMFGLGTASQTASASAASFLWRLTSGLTYAGGIRHTV